MRRIMKYILITIFLVFFTLGVSCSGRNGISNEKIKHLAEAYYKLTACSAVCPCTMKVKEVSLLEFGENRDGRLPVRIHIKARKVIRCSSGSERVENIDREEILYFYKNEFKKVVVSDPGGFLSIVEGDEGKLG